MTSGSVSASAMFHFKTDYQVCADIVAGRLKDGPRFDESVEELVRFRFFE